MPDYDRPGGCAASACPHLAEPGSDYCEGCQKQHDRKGLIKAARNTGYQLANADFRRRLSEIAGGLDPVTELENSLGLLKHLVEVNSNSCNSPAEIMARTETLRGLLSQIEKTAKTMVKMRLDAKTVLVKSTIGTLGSAIGQVIADELRLELEGDRYHAVVDRLMQRLGNTIITVINEVDQTDGGDDA